MSQINDPILLRINPVMEIPLHIVALYACTMIIKPKKDTKGIKIYKPQIIDITSAVLEFFFLYCHLRQRF